MEERQQQRTLIILIAGSDADERAVLRRLLLEDDKFQYEFLEAETIENCIAACLKKKPDCILLDSKNLESLTALGCRILESNFSTVFVTDKNDKLTEPEKTSSVFLEKDALSTDQLSKSVQIAIEKFAHKSRSSPISANALENLPISKQQNQIEKATGEKARYLQTLINSIPQIAWVTAPDGSLQYVNEKWLDFSGLTLEQTDDSQKILELFHSEDREAMFGLWTRAFKDVSPFEFEARMRNQFGDYRWFLIRSHPSKDENGNLRNWFGTSTDITDSKLGQQALLVAERRAAEDYQALLSRIVPLGQTLGAARDLISVYRAVFDFACNSMPCSAFFISFYDSETALRTAAFAWGEGKEIDIGHLPPMPITEAGGVNSQAILNKKTVITNRYMDAMRKRPHVVLNDNGIEPMSSLVAPMIIKNRVVGTLEVQAHENEAYSGEQAVVLEMAASLAAVAIENVRLLDFEAKARREAEAANRAKDEFLAMVTHEIRSPLNAILGWARILSKTKEFDPIQTARAVEVINRSGEMQKVLIDDLLDTARIISGKLRLDVRQIELRPLLESALDTIRPAATAKNIEISFLYDLEQETINADGERLQQIIWNLLVNAVKFTPAEGIITLRASHFDSFVRITVTDTGKGIEPEIMPYIFNRFTQADSAGGSNRQSGLGLGLSLVRYLVELHGGTVAAESIGTDCGAIFTVDLPNLLAERSVFE